MLTKAALLSAASLSFMLSIPAAGQDASPEDVVTVIGLRPVPVDDATVSVTVLDRADLEVRDTPTLVDQLRAAPGVAVSRNGSLGGLTQVRIRGAEANHTLVLIDGVEVSDPTTGETDFGLIAGLDPDRIEVARGEQSVFYGSDAIGGVIAITTNQAQGLRASAEAGTNETFRGQAGGGVAFANGAALSASLSAFTTGGVDTSGLGGEEDGSQTLNLAVRGDAPLGDGWRLSGLARISDTEADFDADTNFDGRLEDVDRVSESLSWNLAAALNGQTGRVDHALRAGFTDVTRETFADGVASDETRGERLKLSYSPAVESANGETRWRLAGLVDAEYEDYERIAPASFFGDPNQSQSFDSYGLAAEARVTNAGFAANASLRQDVNDDQFDDATTWRVGAAYGFDFGGRARASVGRGVKNPTFTELFGFFPGSFIGNPDLKPETSLGWEIGWDQRVGAFDGSVTYFAAELEDEIFTDFTPSFEATPDNRTGESERSGVEAELTWAASETVRVRASATQIRSENDSGAEEIRVPEWTGALSLDWRSAARPGLRAGLALDYVGEQTDTDFGDGSTVTLDSYVTVSATAAVPLNDRVSLTVQAENLFDAEIVDVFGYENPGATLLIGIRVR